MSRTPVSTYRLQLGPDLSFDGAREQLPYLHDLGVTDLYLSPVLQAAPGSTHGYDVVDHDRVSDVMGGRERLEALCDAAHELGMGVVLDIVPNHMAVPTPAWHNRALWSVLADGADSPYADWFDVEWDAAGSLLMPVLGDRIGSIIARGEITLETTELPGLGSTTVLRYFEHVFPVRPGTEQLPLTQLLQQQHYRLAYWRVADEELNYRRFFDVGTLVAVRVERPEVFQATHAVVVDLVRSGHVDGLRIDHPDGLADPRGYLRALHEATDGAWIVAEKILEPAEELPSDWPVAGTTGYDAAWRINQVLHDPAGSAPLAGLMHRLTGDDPMGLADLIEASKRQIVEESLHAEVNRLAVLVAEVCADDIRLRDHTWRAIRDCVTEMVIATEGYRAYVVPGENASGTSVHQVTEAAHRAAARLDEERADTLAVVVDLVLGREVGSAGRTHEARRAEIIIRFQQVCGAVTAKGVEDTAFYRWTHLVSLCEVGGSPATFALGPDALHAWAAHQAERQPASMTAGTTHDTKRGADVRARQGVLSEHATAWVELVDALRTATRETRPVGLDGRTENLLWQMLAGTWTSEGPLAADRLTRYLVKAAREAKDWTRWTAVNERAEDELVTFAASLGEHPRVVELMTTWVERTASTVRAATLGQVLLQLTLPGVADVYQGTETTRIALVDPDNRGPVDHRALAATLERLETASPNDLGEEKLQVVATTLRARRRHAEAVVGPRSGYQALPTSSGHALAYARTLDGAPALVTVVTRLGASLAAIGGWGDHQVVLPESEHGWVDVRRPDTVHPGGSVPLAALLHHGPVALLEEAR
ncbi:malto-oligosyltrehalose synthase [Litorihabitans aurantiacus]|uniref:Malto-oligosyltrehalose synthase n=1 Tax=Litorihabitans aurantiacus TaxID=1930061 RepID=A0AA37XE35_9MICO|nr:malto-oligosyltrehalose synthase [Litorihabitans aurantiacus]GMA31400.1 malto-oligosyltrehalose synthase [Litorihabitans aurantiacus]